MSFALKIYVQLVPSRLKIDLNLGGNCANKQFSFAARVTIKGRAVGK